MSWLYLFLTTIIGVTECQTLVSYSECPMVDELLRKTFEEKTKLEIEISNLRGHVEHLHRDLAHLEKLFKSILIQSKCRPFTFGLMCEPCRCNKTTTEFCDYETGSCKCKPGFQGERCNCVQGKHQCNLTSSYCSSYLFDGSPACFCRDGFRTSSGCKDTSLNCSSTSNSGGNMSNLAYKKLTLQSSTYQTSRGEILSSDKAVDGINSTNTYHFCAHTMKEARPYWYVDLGQEYCLKYVEIVNRGDCCYARLHDVEVTVAGSNKNFTKRCGFFKGPGSASQIIVLQCPKGTRGRYVKLQIIEGRNNFLTLCEVKVIGK